MTRRVCLIRPFGPFEIEVDGALFSTAIPIGEADALLCEWAPHEALLSFEGPSAWYTAEPRTNPRIGVLAHRDQRRFLRLLRPEQLLHHAHEDLRFRVPHMTHETTTSARYGGVREQGVASVVSNFGGPPHNRGPDVLVRNAFVTANGVSLFGRRSKWGHYRRRWWSWPAAPRSYRGEVDGVWADKIELLAHYDVAICLENTCEPHYFSEKFVDAARAGCIPIYRAHATVRDGVLQGARWIDPADFAFDIERTLAHAARADRSDFAVGNEVWLDSEGVRATSRFRVWSKIAQALEHQRGGAV